MREQEQRGAINRRCCVVTFWPLSNFRNLPREAAKFVCRVWLLHSKCRLKRKRQCSLIQSSILLDLFYQYKASMYNWNYCSHNHAAYTLLMQINIEWCQIQLGFQSSLTPCHACSAHCPGWQTPSGLTAREQPAASWLREPACCSASRSPSPGLHTTSWPPARPAYCCGAACLQFPLWRQPDPSLHTCRTACHGQLNKLDAPAYDIS